MHCFGMCCSEYRLQAQQLHSPSMSTATGTATMMPSGGLLVRVVHAHVTSGLLKCIVPALCKSVPAPLLSGVIAPGQPSALLPPTPKPPMCKLANSKQLCKDAVIWTNKCLPDHMQLAVQACTQLHALCFFELASSDNCVTLF